MKCNIILKYYFFIYFFQFLISCNQQSKKTEFKINDTIKLNEKESIDYRYDNDYLLNKSYNVLKKLKWLKYESSIVNDEYDEWLETIFYYSEDKWLKISYGDNKGKYPNYLESNVNIFLKKAKLKLGDSLKNSIFDNEIDIDFDEGRLVLNEKNIKYYLDCSESINIVDFEKIIESKETNNQFYFPKNLNNCKVVFFRIHKKI